MFGCSTEELGLHSSKSQPVFERNTAPEIEASKSLVLGDMLAFLQQFINRIIKKVFPGYEIEFVGYERDDPQQVLSIAKQELESYKTLNEVRKEKGLPPLTAKWADECPANPQFVQMYQALQMSGEMEDMEYEDGSEEAAFDGENNDGDSGDEEIDATEGDFGSDENEDAGNQNVEKSLTFVL